MSVFRRRQSKWQKVGKSAAKVAASSAVRAGAGAVAGLITVTAASAAVSNARRKAQS
jgi:ammonia channel protein AmtB